MATSSKITRFLNVPAKLGDENKLKLLTFSTGESWAATILRVLLGLVIFPHGAQKLFGWYGGFGFSETMIFFTDTMGLPWIIGFLVIILESLGAVVLILGAGTRIIAALFALLAIGITYTSHLQNGFFMNWFGNQPGEGYEFFILWIGMALALVLLGGGKYSVDRLVVTTTKTG